MVKFTVDELRALMSNTECIRNIAVIAHVDHGKSTLTDSLIAKAGMLSEGRAGSSAFLDGRADEREKGITIKSSGITLGFPEAAQPCVVNLIDSPGHVDFSSEVTAALRITDGALVVVDCVEGACVQTETVLRQALMERVKPVLVLNKLDRYITELQLEPEDIYQNLVQIVDSINDLVSTYTDASMGDLHLSPLHCNVAFASGRQCWGFTLDTFARIYAERLGLKTTSLRKKLWGEWYYDAEAKQWVTQAISATGKPLQRGFCEFILRPLIRLSHTLEQGNVEDRLLSKLGIELKTAERELTGKALIKAVLQKWINLGDCLIELIHGHLPSPRTAQAYRVEHLYQGPLDDASATGIRNCDPDGPLVVYISKMLPSSETGRFIAFGRVFSGTARGGELVKIMGPQYNGEKDVFFKKIQKTVVVMGTAFETVDSLPCGNIIGVCGVDNYLTKSGTLTSLADACPLKPMVFSVHPVVRVSIKPKSPADLPRLLDGIRRLDKQDSLVKCTTGSNGDIEIAGCGELHLDTVLRDLRTLSRVEFTVSNPVVPFQEGVLQRSAQVVLAKANNKLNRLFVTAEPLDEGLVAAIDSQDFQAQTSQRLITQFNWDPTDARNLWAFGPQEVNTNAFVNQAKGIQYLNEVRDSVLLGFETCTSEGPLCGEPMRGVRFNLVDALIHGSSSHRGTGQIYPAARRACSGAFLCAEPCVYEPIYETVIQCSEDVIGGVYAVLNQCRGQVVSHEPVAGTPLQVLTAYVPVAESFGIVSKLQEATSGKAFAQSVFHHWEQVPGSPFQEGSIAHQVVALTRARKSLPVQLPVSTDYSDKL